MLLFCLLHIILPPYVCDQIPYFNYDFTLLRNTENSFNIFHKVEIMPGISLKYAGNGEIHSDNYCLNMFLCFVSCSAPWLKGKERKELSALLEDIYW